MKSYSDKKILELLQEACDELNTPAKTKGAKARGGQKIWAEKNGISPQYLGEVLKGKKPLLAHIVQKLDKDFRYAGEWFKVPKHMRKKKNWSFKELMENADYNDN